MGGQNRIFIAGSGVITAVGGNTGMTAAAVRAGISGYQKTDNFSVKTQQPMTMACVPVDHLDELQIDIDEGSHYSGQFNSIIKMALYAIQEAVSGLTLKEHVPLILAMPENNPPTTYINPKTLLSNLVKHSGVPLSTGLLQFIRTGRAAGIQGLILAQQYLFEQGVDYVLFGGSDSYWAPTRLRELDEAQRILTPESQDGFAPGEGAGFLLLTRHPELAQQLNNQTISLSTAGTGEEPGHLLDSDQPYRGDGLDQAFKLALQGYSGAAIDTIYSSMNGENYWAKEYGVAMIRNQQHFTDDVTLHHPADCYGDLGAATGSVLIALAAENLFKQPDAKNQLVYSSSDGPTRAAVRLEKTILNAQLKERSA